jgi:hypothetical protein
VVAAACICCELTLASVAPDPQRLFISPDLHNHNESYPPPLPPTLVIEASSTAVLTGASLGLGAPDRLPRRWRALDDWRDL